MIVLLDTIKQSTCQTTIIPVIYVSSIAIIALTRLTALPAINLIMYQLITIVFLKNVVIVLCVQINNVLNVILDSTYLQMVGVIIIVQMDIMLMMLHRHVQLVWNFVKNVQVLLIVNNVLMDIILQGLSVLHKHLFNMVHYQICLDLPAISHK